MLGCVAGLLLALDGLELVLSRTAILDIFVMFWVLAAFGLLVIDRDQHHRPAGSTPRRPPGRDDSAGPKLGIRWLRVAAGLCLGAACASKWNGVWFLVAFAGLAIAWDLGARRAAGYTNWLAGGLRSDAKWLPVWFGLRPPWSTSRRGPAGSPPPTATTGTGPRRTATTRRSGPPSTPGTSTTTGCCSSGSGLDHRPDPTSPTRSAGSCWPGRSRSTGAGNSGPSCGVRTGYAQEVLAIGTPLIWWGGTLALLFCLGWWLTGLVGDLVFGRTPRRDWRAGAVLLGVAAGWLPWIWYAWHDNRTEFYYYAVAFEPFLIIAITLCLGLIIGPARAAPGRRAVGAVAAGAYLVAVLLNLAYLYPS